ncbi:PHB depolymerase family esterase [Kitasatospora gansuensis]
MHVRSVPRLCWAALTLLAVLAGLLGLQPGRATAAASLTQVTGFGSNPGNLLMYRYVPTGLASGLPLVVALHGCTQSAAAFDDETGWTRWAEQWGFALLLPQQQSANNSSSCFNWYQSGDFSRDQGEALSIRQMIDRTKADLGTDAARVYVTGLSAGGAMTAALLADYPDVFAGGGVVAGLPARCATSQTQASVDCMTTGRNLTPAQWGDLVRGSYPSWTGPWPKVSIWHGSSDYVVKSTNLTELMEQWTDANGTGQTPTVSDTVGGYPHAVYTDAADRPGSRPTPSPAWVTASRSTRAPAPNSAGRPGRTCWTSTSARPTGSASSGAWTGVHPPPPPPPRPPPVAAAAPSP